MDGLIEIYVLHVRMQLCICVVLSHCVLDGLYNFIRVLAYIIISPCFNLYTVFCKLMFINAYKIYSRHYNYKIIEGPNQKVVGGGLGFRGFCIELSSISHTFNFLTIKESFRVFDPYPLNTPIQGRPIHPP